jgi:hypothetical protein
MTPTDRAALHARLDAMLAKTQRIGWQIAARDCELTFARIDRAMAAGYGRDGPEIPGGLLSCAAVRSELRRLDGVIATAIAEITLAQLGAKANFNPAQPRVPKDNPGGGQWTREGGLLSTDLSAVRRRPPGGTPPRLGFQKLGPNLDQQLRYADATRRADEALAQVKRYDPTWKPTLGAYDMNAEGAIRRARDEALEAEKRFFELMRDAPAQGASQAAGDAESTEDIIAPGGRPVGTRFRGADYRTRTVSPSEFYDGFERLRRGAWPADPPGTYEGLAYGRVDGTMIGLRYNEKTGLTFDLLESNHPSIPRGFKVHQR